MSKRKRGRKKKRSERKASPHRVGKPNGLAGEVFDAGGRVAISVPPNGAPDAIPFEVTWDYPASDEFPAWSDMLVNGEPCRILTEITRNPFRLADCVAFAGRHRTSFPPPGAGHAAAMELPPGSGNVFCFWRSLIGGASEVLIITTQENMNAYGGAR